ncbi:MAG: prepilin-type N-terminal cleavage/methylation domain-containing protein [Lentisphaerae bacterium]|nr:prepilin-type N-terminal cleavage/methylation domain-containing protein [Lentisphaerota bacterium]
MTLIELLIVLALLGGLASLALSGMGEFSARERVETTRQRLDAIHGAVSGAGVNPGRFLADMGRPPKVQETESGMILSELWKLPNNALNYGVVDFDFTANPWPEAFAALPDNISLGCGWNGPYAMLSGKKLYDGFGNDFRLLLKQSDNSLAWEDVAGDDTKIDAEIYGVQSLGQDNAVDATGVTPEWHDADSARDFVNDYAAGFTLAPETTLTVIVKARDVMLNTWQNPVEIKVYSSSVTYNKNDYVTDSAGQYLFRCKQDGTVGQSLPSPPSGDAYWDYCRELSQEPHPWLTHVRIALFIPDISATSKAAAWIKSWDTSDFAATFTFTNLTPGIRKLYAYGAIALSGTSWANVYGTGSEALTIELKPGANLITVYLTEKLN